MSVTASATAAVVRRLGCIWDSVQIVEYFGNGPKLCIRASSVVRTDRTAPLLVAEHHRIRVCEDSPAASWRINSLLVEDCGQQGPGSSTEGHAGQRDADSQRCCRAVSTVARVSGQAVQGEVSADEVSRQSADDCADDRGGAQTVTARSRDGVDADNGMRWLYRSDHGGRRERRGRELQLESQDWHPAHRCRHDEILGGCLTAE